MTGNERRWVDEGLLAGREPWPGPWIPSTAKVVVHASGKTIDVFEIDSDRAGGNRVWSGDVTIGIESIGSDGRSLAFVDSVTRPWYLTLLTLKDVSGLPADAAGVLKPLVPSTGQQNLSDLSPDMKWLAYTSDESGQYEVWVMRLPRKGSPIQVTSRGCELPRWSPRSDGLFYRCGQRWYWAALTGSDDPAFREPELFLEGDYLNIAGPEYEVHPDGKRLLLLQGSGERTRGTLDMITNWRAELERRLPLPAR